MCTLSSLAGFDERKFPAALREQAGVAAADYGQKGGCIPQNYLPATIGSRPHRYPRLDTDWYESTRHELVHLFPRLVPGAVLIIDDYGDWEGSRKAVDEYLEENGLPIFLSRIDSARLAIMPGYKLATAPQN